MEIRNPVEHTLKCWPRQFCAMDEGRKPWEFRKDDRGFKVGDILNLEEWDPGEKEYTDRDLRRRIVHIVRGPSFGIPEGYVIMSLEEIS